MRILHVLRAPVGGLFRHVCDLVKGQSALGHDIGIICDSTTGGAGAEAALGEIAKLCKLGLFRMAMAQKPSPGDLPCIAQTRKIAKTLNVDVIHGHGAKGGLYARLASHCAKHGAVYTPHGGSTHYGWASPSGFFYLITETWLRRRTAGLAFVCEYEKQVYDQKIGIGGVPVNVVHNGLWGEEFKPVLPSKEAADLLFVGEMVENKGVDLLLRAIAQLKPKLSISAAIVGDGGQLADYQALAKTLGIAKQIDFKGRMGIAKALPLGKFFVLPSRRESFPYVVLEVMAAVRPMIAARVGGLTEMLPDQLLFEPDNVDALAAKLFDALSNGKAYTELAQQLSREAPEKFSAESMVQCVTRFYSTLK